MLFRSDEIVFVDQENYNMVYEDLKRLEVLDKCIVLDIPDQYSFNDSELFDICRKQYENK